MTEELLPIDKIVSEATKRGVDFGKGNPQNRIRYLTKHSLLPYAKRKLPLSTNNSKCTVAHYSTSIVSRLVAIEKLRNKGLSVRKIKDSVDKGIILLEDEALKADSLINVSREAGLIVFGSTILGSFLEKGIRSTLPLLLFVGMVYPISVFNNLKVSSFIANSVFIMLKSLVFPHPILKYLLFSNT